MYKLLRFAGFFEQSIMWAQKKTAWGWWQGNRESGFWASQNKLSHVSQSEQESIF